MPTIYADPPPALVRDSAGIEYHMDKQLGRGGFAICWQAQQVNTAQASRKTVALKIVKSKMEVKKVAQKFVTELQLHSKLQHPNIVAFHQAFAFQSSTYVVLELCSNGSVADWLKKRAYLTLPEVRRCIIQTCGAMKYLHMRNIVHRDLKAGNLFLERGMNIKVGDFGLAAVLVNPDDAAVRRTTMCGTPKYIAPEVLEKGGKGHNEKVDIWAIGILAYTLAVGRAPFHASKPDQVLLRVAKGDYTWPDLEMHQNESPDELRDIVSQILVDENQRPSLDAIVSHDFFKLGYLPNVLDEVALTSVPKWAVKPPTPATTKRGYTVAWYKQCRASGVGEYAEAEFFPVVGDYPSSSIFRECEREAESGKMPVVPMPESAIYVPFVYRRGKGSTGGLEIMKEGEVFGAAPPLVESSVNNQDNIPSAVEILPRNCGVIEQHDRNTLATSRRAPAYSYAESTKVARRPTVSNVRRAGNDAPVAPSDKPIAQLKSNSTKQLPIRPARARPVRENPQSASHHIPTATDSTSEHARSMRAASCNTSRKVAGIRKTVPSTRSSSRLTTRLQSTRAATIGHTAPRPTEPTLKPVSTPLSSDCGVSTRSRAIKPSGESHRNPYIDPSAILALAEELRNNINTALTSGSKSSSTFSDSIYIADRLPFVCNWVDYSRKHGVGYVLAEGSVGIITNHTDAIPVMHTVVENGYKYFKTTDDGLKLKGVPYTFFMQANDGSLEEAILTDTIRKQHTTLWARFALCMCKQLKNQRTDTASEESPRPITIVRFYQRMGNVSIWGFSNGCFQFNFPDHTKIVLSADGTHAAFTVLPLSAIKHMNTDTSSLPFDLIKAREVISGTVDQLLHGAQPAVTRTLKSTTSSSETDAPALVTANRLQDKLLFVVDVVGHWISGRGLGRRPVGAKWPVWGGTALDDAWGSKLDWVTVGRFGGDERSRAE